MAKKKVEGQNLSLEEAFSKMEEILSELESEDISLEEAFEKYQKGVQLLKYCNDTIDTVEKKVLQLDAQGNEVEIHNEF